MPALFQVTIPPFAPFVSRGLRLGGFLEVCEFLLGNVLASLPIPYHDGHVYALGVGVVVGILIALLP